MLSAMKAGTQRQKTVEAVQHVRRMRGGAQSHLMRCSDGNFYVVKFRNNPQHLRVLANEMLAARLAEHVGLPVPTAEVSPELQKLIANPYPPTFNIDPKTPQEWKDWVASRAIRASMSATPSAPV